jgi:parvulin-like peptidyl-prolyl isomerase
MQPRPASSPRFSPLLPTGALTYTPAPNQDGPRASLPAALFDPVFPAMEGPVAMNGSDAQARSSSIDSPRRSLQRWLWTLGTVAAVITTGVTIRLLSGIEASAQAPVVRPGSPTAQVRPGTASPSQPIAKQPASAAPVRGQQAAQQAATRPSANPAAPPATAGATGSKLPAATTLQVMAVINGEQITRTDLGRECIRRYGEEVLESMVNRHLIAEACAQRGIQVTEADVTAEIDKIAGRFGLSRDRWVALLREERGFSEEQYRREVVWPMLALRQIAASKIEVTDAELKKAFESEYGQKVRARLIAVNSQQKAQQARAEAVANPNSFGELSKKYSDEPGVASAYGVIPPIRKHLGDANLEQVAFALKQGQVSQIVTVGNMHYILKCEEILPQQYLSSQQIAEQQARLKDKLKENKLRQAAGDFFESMQKQAQVVNVFNDPAKQQQMPNVAATINGKPISLAQLADECVTRHGSEVLDGEINRKILQQEMNRKKVVVSEQDIDAEVARAAEAYGFVKPDGTPDIDKWLKSVTEQPGATVDLYVRDAVWPSVALKKLVGSKVEVTDEDMRKAFESNYGERVEVLAIVVSDNRQAQKVWDLARNNNTDAFFAELAQQYSVEPASRGNGGKVPPIRRHGGSPLVEDEAFKLKAGELSGIVAVDGQFIIMRCQGRTRPVQSDFNAVKSELIKDIQEKKVRLQMTREFDRLRDVAQVDNFLVGASQSGGARSASAAPLAPTGPAGRISALPAGSAPSRGASPTSASVPQPAGSRVR